MKKDFEARLDGLREEALANGVVTGKGGNVVGGPIPARKIEPVTGYAGEGIVKPPVWTWEIPVYFFVGGLAGMAAIVAAASWLSDAESITRAALWIGGAGAMISPVLLIMDLGRPARFLHMLRVFKIRSPMSVGAWILSAFGAHAVPAAILFELLHAHLFGGALRTWLVVLAILLVAGEAFWGILLATYTGVLLGATVVPAWYLHRISLPVHFGTVGLGCAVGLLELLGYRHPALQILGILAATIETVLWILLELQRHGPADHAVHAGNSGWLIRIADLCTGPASLILRWCGVIPVAAILFLAGGLLSRFGWIAAGRASGRDPKAVLAAQGL